MAANYVYSLQEIKLLIRADYTDQQEESKSCQQSIDSPCRIIRGFLSARRWCFADSYGEDGRAPQEPQHAVELTSEAVLRLVVMPDEQGRYHFDEMGYEILPEYLGHLIGYLGEPLAPDEAEHYRKEPRPTRMSS